jgi:C-terminal processing protease CtpA/Prc
VVLIYILRKILKVTADSVASKSGLNGGDRVVRLSGKPADAMTHLMAQQTIANAGNSLEIIVQRSVHSTNNLFFLTRLCNVSLVKVISTIL